MRKIILILLFTVFCSSFSFAKKNETFKLCTDLGSETEIFFSKMFVPNKGWMDCEKIDKNSRSDFKKPEDLIKVLEKKINSKSSQTYVRDLKYCATKGQSANDSSADYWMVRMMNNCSPRKFSPYKNVKYIGNDTWQINYDGKSFPKKNSIKTAVPSKQVVSKPLKESEKTSEKITIEYIDHIFIEKFFFNRSKKNTNQNDIINIGETNFIEQLKTSIKRNKNRDMAKCLYENKAIWSEKEKCSAKITRNGLKKSELGKKRKPGDIFYVMDAVMTFLPGDRPGGIVQVDKFEEITPGMRCYQRKLKLKENSFTTRPYYCPKYKDKFKKKLAKFEKDPSNKKVLGTNVVKYIENVKLLNRISEKLGERNNMYTTPTYLSFDENLTRDYRREIIDKEAIAAVGGVHGKNFFYMSDYSLLGDVLNDLVGEVKKNRVSPEIKKRKILLHKYSIILRNIKTELEKENYKKIDKDISKLSTIYNRLKSLEKSSNEIAINIDTAINVIFDTNNLIQKSVSSKKNSNEDKLLSLAVINFMQSLIDSIVSIMPEKYIVENKELNKNLYNDYDLASIENFVNRMTIKNKEKIKELKKSNKKIDVYINTSNIIKKLSNLGINNITDKEITITSAAKNAELQIMDNLHEEIFKSTRNVIEQLEESELSDMSEELSEVASEVASDSSFQEATSDSVLDKQFGEVSLKQLIGAARNR